MTSGRPGGCTNDGHLKLVSPVLKSLQSSIYMDFVRLSGLLLVSLAALAQQQSVEITSEPSHHLVMENAYVRVFDVTVAPKASTLVHRHNNDYVFVTLGDSDVISARPGEKPAALVLKDGEIRYTPGKFAHAAINQSDKPFHNITIELLKPATNVKSCNGDCVQEGCLGATLNSPPGPYPVVQRQIITDQWKMSLYQASPSILVQPGSGESGALLIAVSNLEIQYPLTQAKSSQLTPGGISWISSKNVQSLKSADADPARYVLLEFNPEKQ